MIYKTDLQDEAMASNGTPVEHAMVASLAATSPQVEYGSDDGTRDGTLDIDQYDDTATKRVHLDSLNGVTTAEVLLYGQSDGCASPFASTHSLMVNGHATTFSPCTKFSASAYGWKPIYNVPLEFLQVGENTFEITDSGSSYSSSNLFVGLDFDSGSDDSEAMETNPDTGFIGDRGGEVMLRVRLTLAASSENRAPQPCFTYFPETPVPGEAVGFSAGCSRDDRDGLENLQFRWDFRADGIWDTPWTTATSASHSFSTSGSYLVYLEVRDSVGKWAGTDRIVVVSAAGDRPPMACATVSQSVAFAPASLRFSAECSSDDRTGTYALRYAWDWDNDGNSDTGFSTSNIIRTKTFSTAGLYPITVWAMDSNGNEGAAQITVRIAAANMAPVACISVPPNVPSHRTVQLDASCSTDDYTPPSELAYAWRISTSTGDLYDEAPAIGKTSFAFYPPKAATFTVYLQVWDPDGKYGSAWRSFNAFNEAPFVCAHFNYFTGLYNKPFVADPNCSEDADTPFDELQFQWDWGDGSGATAWSPAAHQTHTYSEPGNYTVILRAKDRAGATSSLKINVSAVNVTVEVGMTPWRFSNVTRTSVPGYQHPFGVRYPDMLVQSKARRDYVNYTYADGHTDRYVTSAQTVFVDPKRPEVYSVTSVISPEENVTTSTWMVWVKNEAYSGSNRIGSAPHLVRDASDPSITTGPKVGEYYHWYRVHRDQSVNGELRSSTETIEMDKSTSPLSEDRDGTLDPQSDALDVDSNDGKRYLVLNITGTTCGTNQEAVLFHGRGHDHHCFGLRLGVEDWDERLANLATVVDFYMDLKTYYDGSDALLKRGFSFFKEWTAYGFVVDWALGIAMTGQLVMVEVVESHPGGEYRLWYRLGATSVDSVPALTAGSNIAGLIPIGLPVEVLAKFWEGSDWQYYKPLFRVE